MFLAIMGRWGTHYDAAPDNLPEMGWFTEWIITGLIPQLTFWMGVTLAAGLLFGLPTYWLAMRRRLKPAT